MIRVWRSESSSEEDWTHASLLNSDAFMGFKKMAAVPLADCFPPATVEILSKRAPPDYFNTFSMFIISGELKAILQEFDVNAEFIALKVLYQSAPYTERRFYFANLLDKLDCLDYEDADYEFSQKPGFTDYVRRIRKLVIDESKTEGYHLFRMANVGHAIVCVSEELAKRIEESGLTGMKFVAPSDFRRY